MQLCTALLLFHSTDSCSGRACILELNSLLSTPRRHMTGVMLEEESVIPGHAIDPRSSFIARLDDPVSYSLPMRAAPRRRFAPTHRPAGNSSLFLGGAGGAAQPEGRGVMRTGEDVRASAAAAAAGPGADTAGDPLAAALLPPAGRYSGRPFYAPLLGDAEADYPDAPSRRAGGLRRRRRRRRQRAQAGATRNQHGRGRRRAVRTSPAAVMRGTQHDGRPPAWPGERARPAGRPGPAPDLYSLPELYSLHRRFVFMGRPDPAGDSDWADILGRSGPRRPTHNGDRAEAQTGLRCLIDPSNSLADLD
jgi:hypothetical protein